MTIPLGLGGRLSLLHEIVASAQGHSRRKSWEGNLDAKDPLASPLFGSLDGLPPTCVYSSSRDLLIIDALRLRDRVLAEHIPHVTFRLRQGLLHDFVSYAPLPDAKAERTNLYSDLGVLRSTRPLLSRGNRRRLPGSM